MNLTQVINHSEKINLLNEDKATLEKLCDCMEIAAMRAYELEDMKLGERFEAIANKAYSLFYEAI